MGIKDKFTNKFPPGDAITEEGNQVITGTLTVNELTVTDGVNTGVMKPNPTFLVEGGTVSYKDIGFDKIVSLESVNTFTLPDTTTLTHTDFFINLENNTDSILTITIKGGDTIQGEVTQTIDIGENMKLRINGANYRFN